MLRKITILKFIIISIILSGCVSRINNSNNFIVDLQQAAKINKLNTWELQGKLSWHDEKNKQAAMCYIKWVKNYNKSYITLNSFMNLKSINLEIENGKIKIINNSNILTKDIENIINNISLNIDNFTYWILGTPNPKYKYELINGGFKQQGWAVNCSHHKIYKDFVLQTQIIFKYSDLIIKIIINNFN